MRECIHKEFVKAHGLLCPLSQSAPSVSHRYEGTPRSLPPHRLLKVGVVAEIAFLVILARSQTKTNGRRGKVVQFTPHHRGNQYALLRRVELVDYRRMNAVIYFDFKATTRRYQSFPASTECIPLLSSAGTCVIQKIRSTVNGKYASSTA